MSWDDEDGEWDAPKADEDDGPVLTDKWDGEDEDDDALLGDDWDVDPEDKKKEAEAKKAAAAPVKKALSKRQLAKKREEEERAAAMKRKEMLKQEEDDPAAAARRRARIKAEMEASNLNLVADCFGGDGYEAPENGEFVNEQLELDNSDMAANVAAEDLKKIKIKTDEPLENVELKTIEDYKKFGTKVAKLTSAAAKQKMIVEFAKVLLTDCTQKMKLDECTELKKLINVICNKKQKEEAGKKKKNNKKAQLTMSRNNDPFDDDGGGYDDMGDFL